MSVKLKNTIYLLYSVHVFIFYLRLKDLINIRMILIFKSDGAHRKRNRVVKIEIRTYECLHECKIVTWSNIMSTFDWVHTQGCNTGTATQPTTPGGTPLHYVTECAAEMGYVFELPFLELVVLF